MAAKSSAKKKARSKSGSDDNDDGEGESKEPEESALDIYKWIAQFFKPYWLRTILTLAVPIPIGALEGAIAFSLKPFVEGFQSAQTFNSLAYVPLVVVGITLVQGLLNYLSIYLNGWLGFRVMSDLRKALYQKLLTMDVSYFDQASAGFLIQRFYRDAESVNTNILNNLKTLITRFSSTICLMGILVYTSWKLSLISITVLLLMLYPSTQIRKIIKSLNKKETKVSAKVLSFYTEAMGGARVIYGYNLPAYNHKVFGKYQRILYDRAMKGVKIRGWLTPVMHMIAAIGVALVIWQGSLMVLAGDMTEGGFVSFIVAMIMLYNPMKNLGNNLMAAQSAYLAAARIKNLFNVQPSISDRPHAKKLKQFSDCIELQNVFFEYVPGQPVLKNISLKINKGEKVAIVGVSGAGKSTIVNLLPRFYDVQSGMIRIDGKDIRDYKVESIRKHIAIVLQDTFIFDGKLLKNVAIGNIAKKDDEAAIWDALDKACLKDFVESLPEGLYTRVGERGVMLSGGQRQRLAIARALLRDASIVILDEATSSLDNKSEAKVYEALESLMQDRTVIMIAHRLSSLRGVDRVLVIEDGMVVEEGTQEDLMRQNGKYAELYHAQFAESKQAAAEAEEVGISV
ncbi:ABC transporter ATP-binding protein [Vampirovibrio sp.]|uniref:ABC transporter ATP-binding protein n=1 Tax=Vampirovibrio sp. TaxID=2717857 RepID=UPI0035944F8D